METVVACISGWGSRCEIFSELLSHCPQLAGRRRIDLSWQDFVAIPQPSERRAALRQRLLQKLVEPAASKEGGREEYSGALKRREAAAILLQKDILLLGWSLGSLLCLELSLELSSIPDRGIHTEFAPELGQTPGHLGLILLSPTAAMCGTMCRTWRAGSPYPGVPPVALKLMQRGINQPQNNVLQDFAKNCRAPGQTEGAFVAKYTEQAQSFSPEELKLGLDYLLNCDLRAELQQKNFPYDALLFSGRSDAIVPSAQSAVLAHLLFGEPTGSRQLQLLNGGHNLLCPPSAELLGKLDDYFNRR